ncbi:hypothetical protein BH24CHL6_BH24CHL6_06720 [soil metagenome]
MGEDEVLQPVTERTRAAGSARLAALSAAALLVSVIWFGVWGRSDVPEQTPPAAALAAPVPPSPAAETASPLPALASPPPTIEPAATPLAATGEPHRDEVPLVIPRRYGPLGEDAFAVTIWLEGRFYMNVLHEVAPGHVAAVMRLPLYAEMPTTHLQLIQLWTRDDRPPLADVAAYDLMLAELLVDPPPELLFEVVVDAKPGKRKAPRLIREGFALTVRTEVRTDHAYLLFDVTVGRAQPLEMATDRLLRITHGWRDFGQRGQGLRQEQPTVRLEQDSGRGRPPLVRFVAQPGTPRGTMILGYSWVAGY